MTSGSPSPPSLPPSSSATSAATSAARKRPAAREPRIRYADAPQLLVPNPAGVAFTRLLGRSTRFRRTDGPLRRRGDRARPRPLAHVPQRASRASRLVPDAGRDRCAGAALGHRAERGGGPQPRRAARLDRPAARPDRRAGRRTRPKTRCAARPPARPPTPRSTTRCSTRGCSPSAPRGRPVTGGRRSARRPPSPGRWPPSSSPPGR